MLAAAAAQVLLQEGPPDKRRLRTSSHHRTSRSNGLHQRRRLSHRSSCQISTYLHVVMPRANILPTAAGTLQNRRKSQAVRHPHCALRNMTSPWLRSRLARQCHSPTTHRAIDLGDVLQLGDLPHTRFIPRRRTLSVFVDEVSASPPAFALCNVDMCRLPSLCAFNPPFFRRRSEMCKGSANNFAERAPDQKIRALSHHSVELFHMRSELAHMSTANPSGSSIFNATSANLAGPSVEVASTAVISKHNNATSVTWNSVWNWLSSS